MKLEFHHINIVSKNVDELNNFYKNILQMDSISETDFQELKLLKAQVIMEKLNLLLKVKFKCI